MCAKIAICGIGEREPTQGSVFSAGHQLTQNSAFGEEFESTQSSAFGVGHKPTQDSVFGEGRESTQTHPWVRQGGSAQPAGPQEVDTAISKGVGACQPHGVEVCQATAVVLRSRLWKMGHKNRR